MCKMKAKWSRKMDAKRQRHGYPPPPVVVGGWYTPPPPLW